MTITFSVPGRCKPAGSKRGFINKYTGRVAIVDACEKSKDWKADVSHAARAAYKGPLICCACAVSFEFIVSRPGGHYGSGKNSDKLKLSAPAWATTKPDLLKLARGIEDAMTGVIYHDDSLIVQEVLRKDYAHGKDAFIGVTVTISTLEAMPVNGVRRELIPSGEAVLL